MKHLIVIATLLLAGVGFAAAQTPTSNQTEQELKRLTRELADSALRGDKAVAERYLADGYIETDGYGHVATRAQVLANYPGNASSMKATMDLEDIQVHDYGDTAVVSARAVMRLEANGQKITNSYRTTDIWMRRNGGWQLIAEHYSNIPAERVPAKVDPKIYDAYVGQYEMAPEVVITITREGDKLMFHQTGVQKKMELLPENETTFFMKGFTGQNIFVRDAKGQVTHIVFRDPDGQEIKAKKIK
jgi:ketosteroid isomerase-like protein